ncbi:hypothetical protein ATPR_1815 [Acetobacter tropicalis NBRC 101654]|nr:hypothetical protein ATPR_1815 [Acetobacter tropicalis NBRC 101654]
MLPRHNTAVKKGHPFLRCISTLHGRMLPYAKEKRVKIQYIAAFVTSGILMAGSPALAQQFGGPGNQQQGPHQQGGRGMQAPPPPPQRGGGHGRMANGPGGGRGNNFDNYDMNRRWQRGQRYDGPQNDRWIVNNWQGRPGLWAPPSGYRWLQYGNQFLLTSITTGIIAGVVSGAISSSMAPY